MALADTTALLSLVQSLNVADAEPATVYMSSKSLNQLIPSGTPEGFITAVRDRLQNPNTKDDLAGFAYLAKTMVELDGYNVINGAWYGYGATVKSMSLQGKTKFPAWTNDTLPVPTGVEVFTASTGTPWVPSGGIPAWWNDSTLVRLRCWGGGGSGAYRQNTYACSGGGGGGYSEFLIPYSQLLKFNNGNISVGSGGATTTSSYGVGNGGGYTGIGDLGASGGGGGHNCNGSTTRSNVTYNGYSSYTNQVGSYSYYTNGNYYGSPSQAGGSGVGTNLGAAVTNPQRWAIYNASGGSSGEGNYNSSYYGTGASGGGGAGGPWGIGRQGGSSTGVSLATGARFYGGSGGGTSQASDGNGLPIWTNDPASVQSGSAGGASAAFNAYWKTSYLMSRLGGTPGTAGTSSAGPGSGGAGCGGGGAFSNAGDSASYAAAIYKGGDGGAFGGGGGSSSNNVSGAIGGSGGIAAGGGGTGNQQNATGGAGGNGLLIIEYFV